MLDKLTYSGRKENLDGVDCELQVGDIADPEAVARAAEGCEAIVNFAAETHVDRSILGATDFGRTEFFGTQVLLEEVRRTGARYVQVSTDEVYGDLADGGSASETDPCEPVEPVQRRQGRGRPARSRVCAHLRQSTPRSRAARTPTGRTSTRRSSSRSSSPTRSTASRCPSTATGARSATGCTSRTTAPAIELRPARGCARRGLQRRRRQRAREHRDHPAHPRADRRRPVARPPRHGPARATTAATRSTRPSSAPRLEAASALSRTASPRRSSGTGRTAPGGSRSSPASTCDYYRRQYAERLA